MYRTVPGKGEGRREDTKEKDGGRINRTTYLVERRDNMGDGEGILSLRQSLESARMLLFGFGRLLTIETFAH